MVRLDFLSTLKKRVLSPFFKRNAVGETRTMILYLKILSPSVIFLSLDLCNILACFCQVSGSSAGQTQV
jgi:hypothetical protein